VFIGHFAVALAAKRAAPSVSLGTLFVACELVDLIWPLFLLAGLESVRIDPGNTAFTPLEFIHYPWTHSLLMGAVWAVLLGLFYFLVRKNLRAAIVVAAVVLSHWFLDAVVHRPDLLLVPGGAARIGFGLWSSVAATVAVEGFLFAIGLAVYVRMTRAKDRTGGIALWALVAFLLVAYAAAAFGPPPPNVPTIAWAGIAGGLVTALWGYWVDRHREVSR
jgi:membrane-bound metal-dependent hydrolase YbcI (DUF457 family)